MDDVPAPKVGRYKSRTRYRGFPRPVRGLYLPVRRREIPVQSGLCADLIETCRCSLVPPSSRRRRKTEAHRQEGPYRQSVGIARSRRRRQDPPLAPSTEAQVWHTTTTAPWVAKARRRRRNELAKASRRRNR